MRKPCLIDHTRKYLFLFHLANLLSLAMVLMVLQLALLNRATATELSTKQNYRSVDLGPSHVYKSPYRMVKTDNGQFWYFFKDHILVRHGSSEHLIPLDNLVKKSAYRSVRLEILPLDSGMLFSRRHLLFFVPYADLSIRQLDFQAKPNDFIFGLNQTEDGTIWLTTLKSLYHTLDIDQGFNEIPLPDHVSRPNKRPHMLLSAVNYGANKLLLTTVHSALISVERTGDTEFDAQLLPFKTEVPRNTLYRSLKVDEQLFICAKQGLYRLNLNTNEHSKLQSDDTVTDLRDILLYQDKIWFIANEQLYRTDKNLSRLENISQSANLGFDLTTYKVRSIYADDEDNLWVSIIDKGVFVFNPAQNKFNQVAQQSWPLTAEQAPRAILTIDKRHPIYIVGNRSFIPSYNTIIDEPIQAFYALDEKRFWFGGDNKLALVDSGQIVHQTTVEQREVTSIHANEKTVWYTRSVGAIYSYDVENQHHSKLPHSAIGQLLITAAGEGRLLSISSENIALVDTTGQKPNEILHQSPHETIKIQANDEWATLYYDNGEVAWLDLKTYEYKKLHFATNTTSCVVNHSIDNSWWMAQENGSLIRFNENNTTYQAFNVEHGLPVGGVNGRFCAELDGKLFFSTADGLYTTTEYLGYKNTIKPTLWLTYTAAEKAPVLVNAEQRIELKQSYFPLVFHAANSSRQNPRHNQTQYKLRGLNNNWQTLPSGTDSKEIPVLPEGKYQLQTRVSNNHGVWSDVRTLNISVQPPLWLSTSAKLLYLFVFLASVGGIFFYRTKAIRLRAQRLEKLVQQKTEQIRTEKQTVEKLLASKEQEFIHISHELRTPLTLMTGPLKSISGKSQDPEIEKALAMACRNGERLHRMVDQLLHLERLALENALSKTPQNISQILQLITESFAVYAAKKSITINLNSPPSCYLQLMPDAFDKICVNLLSNAIKYSPHNSTIEVTASFDKTEGLTLIVKDHGIGIEKAALSKVFDKFYRVEDKQSDNETGAGVGLALVKSLVESHLGTIAIDSIYGEGTQVTVKLPVELYIDTEVDSNVNQDLISQELATMQTTESAKTQVADSDTAGLKLLVVEDTADMRNYIIDTLSGSYQCHSAANGKSGLEMAEKIMPDLIICDVMMPVMDGFELTEKIKQNPLTCHIPVILLTARGDKDSRLTGFKSLADDYIAKPFDPQELMIRAENLISLRKLLRQRHSDKVRSGESLAQEKDSELNEKDATFVDKVTNIIKQQLHDETFSTEQLSAKVFMSERQLQRKLKALIDFTPREYLQHLRLQAAEELLLKGERVTEVSLRTGFSSSSYFTRCFKAKYNMTPKQFASKGK